MSWQIPLFINIIFATIRGYLDKKISDRVDPFLAFFYLAFVGAVGYFLLYIIKYNSFPPIYPEMVLLGVLYSFVISLYMSAIRINLTQSSIFASYYLVIPMLLSAIFLGEWRLFNPVTFTGQKTLFGISLALISMLLLLHAHNKKEERLEKKWLIFIVLQILLNGLASFWGKTFINNHGPLETMTSQVMGGVPVMFMINIFRGQKFKLATNNFLWIIIDGTVIVFSVVFYYLAVRSGPLSIVLPVQSLILTATVVLIGLFVYKEAHDFDRNKLIGLILGGLGIMLLVL